MVVLGQSHLTERIFSEIFYLKLNRGHCLTFSRNFMPLCPVTKKCKFTVPVTKTCTYSPPFCVPLAKGTKTLTC